MTGPERGLTVFYLAWFSLLVAASILTTGINPVKSIWWVISFPLALAGRAFLFSRREELQHLLELFPEVRPLIGTTYDGYVNSQESGYEPAIIGWLSGCSFLFLRIGVIWNLTALWQSPMHLFMTLIHSIGLGYVARTIWMFYKFGGLMNALCRVVHEARNRLFSWELLESLGRCYARSAIGAAFLSLGFLVMGLSNFQLFVGDVHFSKTQVLLMEMFLMVSMAIPLLYLVVPQWKLHQILAERKATIREAFVPEYLEAERKFLENPKQEVADRYFAARNRLEDIDELPEWPFHLETVAPILTVFALPPVILFFKEFLVDVVVAWLKG